MTKAPNFISAFPAIEVYDLMLFSGSRTVRFDCMKIALCKIMKNKGTGTIGLQAENTRTVFNICTRWRIACIHHAYIHQLISCSPNPNKQNDIAEWKLAKQKNGTSHARNFSLFSANWARSASFSSSNIGAVLPLSSSGSSSNSGSSMSAFFARNLC
jgi:hypothetical protein